MIKSRIQQSFISVGITAAGIVNHNGVKVQYLLTVKSLHSAIPQRRSDVLSTGARLDLLLA